MRWTAAIFVFLLATIAVVAQTPAEQKPAFEVASVKANKSGRPEAVYQPVVGGRLVITNITLKELVIAAYRLRDSQITGGPGWIDSDRFDINAKADQDVPLSQALEMLQSLLAERFRLVSHRETKDVIGYTLLSGNAPKLKPTEGGDSGIRTAPIQGQGVATIQVVAKNMTMQHFVDVLSTQLRGPVADRTGLQGGFDFSLNLQPSDTTAGTEPDLVPSILTALREQLGLRIESNKAPGDFFIIDSAQRPLEN